MMLSNTSLRNVGIGAFTAAVLGVCGVMLWTPPTTDNPEATPLVNKPKISSENILGKLPKNKDKKEEKKEEKQDEEVSYEVVYNDYEDYGYGYYGGGGYTGEYTTAAPNAHTEQNTAANQTVVVRQAQEDADEKAAEEAKREVANRVLEVVGSVAQASTETTEVAIVVTDDGAIVKDTSANLSGGTSSSSGDNREVIDMGVIAFGDEGVSSVSSTAAASVATVQEAVVVSEPVKETVVLATALAEDIPVEEVIITDSDASAEEFVVTSDYAGSSVVAESTEGIEITDVELLEGEELMEIVIDAA